MFINIFSVLALVVRMDTLLVVNLKYVLLLLLRKCKILHNLTSIYHIPYFSIVLIYYNYAYILIS